MTMSDTTVETPGRRERLRAWFWITLADLMPRRLAYACALRVGAHASCGRWTSDDPALLLFFEALHRWDKSSSRIGTTDR